MLIILRVTNPWASTVIIEILFQCQSNWIFSIFVVAAERDYVVQEDFSKAVRKLAENKKLEGKLDYEKV